MSQKSPKQQAFYWALIGFILGMVLTTLVIQTRSKMQAEEDNPALIAFEGDRLSADQLPADVANSWYDLRNQSYQQQLDLLQQAAVELYVLREAKAQGVSDEDIVKQLLQVEKPDDDAVNAFYNENESRINLPFHQVKEHIREFLWKQRRMAKQQELVAQLQAEGKLEILLPKPVTPVVQIDTAGYPSKGDPGAPVHIVEFADYQCPHCKTAQATLQRLLEEHADQLRMSYLDFPINPSGISRKVAEGAVCADQQGQFWAYHDLAFQHQDSLNPESPQALAQELELDLEQFTNCLKDAATAGKVAASEKQAVALGIHGTPAIFINGRRFQGNDLDESLKQSILSAIPGASAKKD